MAVAVSMAVLAPWRVDARCRGLNPGLFYPDDSDADAVAAARRVCESCPVREDCLAYALAYREREGIWGGATERERRRALRQRRLAAV